MSLSPRTKLAHYEILEPIGRGGMGEVYRAKDSKLGRDVAIKVLPDEFAQDEERLRRFQREAKVLASLNHPNIASIYGLEQSGETHYLVLELVPGETLADRIARGPVPVEECLDIAKKIAEALEEAHERGIVHRDLKPANVKRTPDDKVKVLDFGLAKAFAEERAEGDGASSMSPTITRDATRVGVILGTAAYMSPEQAKGKRVDKRTDIFAFGAVLYEMLTGRKAFPGDDVSEVLASVIKTEPEFTVLPEGARSLESLLRRCLRKEPERRLQHLGDARIELQDVSEEPYSKGAAKPSHSLSSKRLRMAHGLLTVGLGAALVLLLRSGDPRAPASITRFTIEPSVVPLGRGGGSLLAISQDGSKLVSLSWSRSNDSLHLRRMNDLTDAPIPGTVQAWQPFFSPDGEWIAFFALGQLVKAPLSGGVPVPVCDALRPLGGSWGADGTIVFATENDGLLRVAAAGGVPETLLAPEDDESWLGWPDVLPERQGVLYATGDRASLQVSVLDTASGKARLLHRGASQPRYSPTGHVVFLAPDERAVKAISFDLATLETHGSPVTIIEDVNVQTSGSALSTTSGDFDLSDEGTLVYMTEFEAVAKSLVWVNRDGVTRPATASRRDYRSPRLSPDGRSVAVRIGVYGEESHIWTLDLARATLSRITFDRRSVSPTWTPDGTRVVYGSGSAMNGELYWIPADGSGGEEPLDLSGRAGSFSPDGRFLAFTSFVEGEGPTDVFGEGPADIIVFELGQGDPEPFQTTTFDEGGPAFSPDGRFLAFVSNETGRYEVYVRPFPGPGGKWQLSSQGGTEVVWGRDGSEVFYRNGNQMMRVPITTRPSFSPGPPELLFEGPFEESLDWYRPNYDVSSDGHEFLMVTDALGDREAEIVVVLNWFQELRRLVPTDE